MSTVLAFNRTVFLKFIQIVKYTCSAKYIIEKDKIKYIYIITEPTITVSTFEEWNFQIKFGSVK